MCPMPEALRHLETVGPRAADQTKPKPPAPTGADLLKQSPGGAGGGQGTPPSTSQKSRTDALIKSRDVSRRNLFQTFSVRAAAQPSLKPVF